MPPRAEIASVLVRLDSVKGFAALILVACWWCG